MEMETVTHPDEGVLMALLDGEMPSGHAAAIEEHLAGCTECGAALASLRADRERLAVALPALDREPPTELAHRRIEHRRRSERRLPRPLRWAAVLVVGTATGLAAAVPGSPVREWVTSAWQDPPAAIETATQADDAPSATPASRSPAGVAVVPQAGRMRVSFTGAARGLRIRLRVHQGDELEVLTEGGAGQARFRTTSERIEVLDAGSGEAAIAIPRALPEFTLEVNGRAFMVKRGDDLRFPGPPADTDGPEIMFEVRP